jgi:hypothetical protein
MRRINTDIHRLIRLDPLLIRLIRVPSLLCQLQFLDPEVINILGESK